MSPEHPDARNPAPCVNLSLSQKLILETARIGWRELEVHHARGVVVQVAQSLDLIAVALELIQDNRPQFEFWLQAGLLGPVADQDAERWHQQQRQVWALVVAPWVLVQQDHRKKRKQSVFP